MKLLLTSNGITNELKDVFKSLLTKDPSEISVAFIITAALGEPDDPSWVEEYRDQLKNFGITHFEDLDLKGKTKEELENILKDKDLIFVNGGNTYYLLKYVRESGFDSLLPELLNQGKLYIGVSAGSMIIGSNIESAKWNYGIPDVNNVELSDTTGLQIVPFAICPHVKPEEVSIIESHAKEVSYPIWTLNDNQAVSVEDNTFKIVGTGEKIVFNT